MMQMSRRSLLGLVTASAWAAAPWGRAAALGAPPVQQLRITILSTMLAEPGLGEWGFAALVESDGKRLLFDTGAHPDLVLSNCQDLKIDLSDIEEVIVSHNHWDHVGGLLTLRRELVKSNPKALSVAHVGAGIFTPRLTAAGKDQNGLAAIRAAYLELGGQWRDHDAPFALAPGIWLTGPVPRPHDEHNWTPGLHLPDPKTGAPGPEDNVPEDSALIFDTAKGLVALTGCGHAGIVNIAEYAQTIARKAPFDAVVGGLHLLSASDQTIAWTAAQLKSMGVRHLLAAHCTGIEATYKLRDALGLTRQTAVVAAIGSAYSLEDGLHSGRLAG